MKLTRRDLGKLAAAAIPGAGVFNALQAQTTLRKPELFNALRAQGGATKPNSKVAGVQIGLNVPYNFGGRDMNPDELLDRIVKLNVNAVEMRSQPVENFLGSPAANGQKAEADAMRNWRASVSMDRVAAFRKKYEDARCAHRDRQVRRHLQHVRRRGELLLYACAHAGRARHLVRDRRQAHRASANLPTDTNFPLRITATRPPRLSIGKRRSSRRATTGESRSRALRGRQQHIAHAVPQTAPRAHFARAREGPQDEGRADHAVRRRGHPIVETLRLIRDNKWRYRQPSSSNTRCLRVRTARPNGEDHRLLPESVNIVNRRLALLYSFPVQT